MSTTEKTFTDAVPTLIAGQIRAMIARGAISPGMRLGQTELADQFNSSRVPVREALKLLSSEGLVEHDPNRGFFAARLSSHEARQLFRLRELVEDEVLSTLPWPDDSKLLEITALSGELENLLDEGDRSAWWSKHRTFHHMIFDLSPEKIMVREAMRLWSLTDRFRGLLPLPRLGSPERQVVNKHSFTEALTERDRAKLLEVRRQRRQAFEAQIMEMLKDRDL